MVREALAVATWTFSSDDDDRERYTPEAWAEVRGFMGAIFQEIDRPNDWLVRLDAELRGDEGSGESWSFASGLTSEQCRQLKEHLVAELVRDLDRPELPGPED